MTKLGPKECLLDCLLRGGDRVVGTLLSEPANTHLLNVSDTDFCTSAFQNESI